MTDDDDEKMMMMNDDGQMMVDEFLMKHKNAHAILPFRKGSSSSLAFTFTIIFPLIRNNIPGVMTFDTRKR